jgi:predicted DNA-binding protein
MYTNDDMAEPPHDRKERVIHTRVAEDLDEEIKRRAQNLGVSVSNLVRNILQNTIGLVEDIILDGAETARAARRGVRRDEEEAAVRPGARPAILGWQAAMLAVNAVCERCNAILPRGTRAAIAILDGPGPPSFRCESCLEEIRPDAEPRPPDE